VKQSSDDFVHAGRWRLLSRALVLVDVNAKVNTSSAKPSDKSSINDTESIGVSICVDWIELD